MSRVTHLVAAGTVLLSVVICEPAAAQASADLVAQGARAYQDLRFDLAAGLLRRALEPSTAEGLPRAELARALTYLAAVERFRGRRDSALAALRRLVLLDPRYRPDPLVFPPEVTDLFEQVRRAVKVATIVFPADTTLALGGARLTATLHASSPHDVRVTVAAEDGRLLRTLYAGPIGDSLAVRWDGRDSTGRPAAPGRVWFTVASQGDGDRLERLTRLPLDLALHGVDTLAHPAPPGDAELLPERTGRGAATRALIGGVALGAAAIALPPAVARDGPPSEARFVVAGAIGLSGVIGFLTQKPGRPIPHNVAANQALRSRWRAAVAAVARQNLERMGTARLHVQAGPAAVIEGPGS